MGSRIEAYRAGDRRLVAGVMSGTSLDGIDVAFVEIAGSGSGLSFLYRGFHSAPFDADVKARLLDACAGDLSMREAFELDVDLGGLYADAIALGAESLGIPTASIDAVGLHGQTVYHAPRRRPLGLTVQLGSAAVVAQNLGTIVVNDFRSGDVAVGGEGAPLVPYCDYLLLRAPDADRAALNIGGIANVTWLPRTVERETLIAFDTGPGNMMIDAAMRELYGLDYDAAGQYAAQGRPDMEMVARLLTHPYYAERPPKSAGREQFGEEIGRRIAIQGIEAQMFPADIIATLTQLTASSIAHTLSDLSDDGGLDEVIVGGGGARNVTLMRMLAQALPWAAVRVSDDYGLPSDGKEAICFAILANEALCETPANLPSVTGASRPVVCGAIRVP